MAHSVDISIPETYSFSSTPTVPNSALPVLVYRNVLVPLADANTVKEIIEKNRWLQGGVFKTFSLCHFHSVTHECYAIFKGSSKLLLGRGPLDGQEGGAEVDLRAGDVIVLPVGLRNITDGGLA